MDHDIIGSFVVLYKTGQIMLEFSLGRFVYLNNNSVKLFTEKISKKQSLEGVYTSTKGLSFEVNDKGLIMHKDKYAVNSAG